MSTSKNQYLFLVTVLLSVALQGCATWSQSSVDAKSVPITAQAPTRAADVLITDNDLVDRKYVLVGDVTVSVNKTTIFNANPTKEMVNEKLKEKAAELGADAVILVRYGDGGVSFFSWGSLEGKGRAVKFSK